MMDFYLSVLSAFLSLYSFNVTIRENADAQATLTDSMGWTQQDAKRTCLKKRDKM
jgi:hypothetical protein